VATATVTSEINADNAADAIIAKADEICEEAFIAYVRSQGVAADRSTRELLIYLIRKEVWGQLNQQMGFGPDELRGEADTLEEANADEADEDEAESQP
jgi:hypothetical protein